MNDSLRNNEKKIKVLQLISSPEVGGIEKQLLFFLQRYDRDKFTVDVGFGAKTDGALREDYIAAKTRLILCKWSKYIFPFFVRFFFFLKRHRYDVVHARWSEVSGAAMLAAKLAGVPVRIASYHHTQIDWQNPNFMTKLVVGVLQVINRISATKILSISEACLDTYYPDWREHPDKFHICYNGVDLKEFFEEKKSHEVREKLGISSSDMIIGHIGSFRAAKNHKIFIDIAKLVLEQFDNIHFLLVGDGQLRGSIEAKVEMMGLKEKFVFAGKREDIPEMLSAMDIFVMPSINEGFGTAIVEAQASGLAVVASDLPSVKEAVCPKLHKYCCHPDDAAGMAEHIVLLLRSTDLRSELGKECSQYVTEKFSIDNTVTQLELLYAS